jgi:hypothetical protein
MEYLSLHLELNRMSRIMTLSTKSFVLQNMYGGPKENVEILERVTGKYTRKSRASYDSKKRCPTTRHEGAWGRGGIAPNHSRPRH